MGFRPSTKLNPDNCEAGGRDRVEPGKYHIELMHAEDKDTEKDKPYTAFDFQVLEGTNKEQIGRVHAARYYWYNQNETAERMAQEMICTIAVVLGVSTREAIKAKLDAGEDLNFKWSLGIGKQAVIEIENREDKAKGKTYAQIAHQKIWEIDNPKVAGVPKDERRLAAAQVADVF